MSFHYVDSKSGGGSSGDKVWMSQANKGEAAAASARESLFHELFTECRAAAPGARLSYTLRARLERLAPEERPEVVNRMRDGCTPLFLASKRGNVEIVDYLIAQCGADYERRGMYEVPDDHSIHHVTPLWCASVAGRLEVVRCLVAHGACVNSVSDTGSTPVRSACFMTHLEVVRYLVEHGGDILRPNYNGGTCLINSVQSTALCEYLLRHNADVNAQDIQMKTALHYAIQEHRFETTQLLLEHGADPGMRSRSGDDALQTACLKGAHQIFDYLVSRQPYSMGRIAEAFELIGSTYLDEHHDLPLALQFWRNSLKLRAENADGYVTKPVVAHGDRDRAAYQNAVEFTTLEELENLALDLDAMRVQSLLICERILGATHKDTIFRLMYRGAAYADSLQYQRCIDLWLYALRLRIEKDSLLHSEVTFTAQALVRLFLDLLDKHGQGALREEVRYEDVVATIRLLTAEVPAVLALLQVRPTFERQQVNFNRLLGVLVHLVHLLLHVRRDAARTVDMKRLLNAVLRMEPRNSAGDTLLHLAASTSNAMRTNNFFVEGGQSAALFPNAPVAALLLECGAAVDAKNNEGATALHLAARTYHPEVVAVLLEAGSHLDQRDGAGVQAQQLLASAAGCNLPLINYLSLKCLSAQAIVRHNIVYRGELPVVLEDFVQLH